MEWQMTLVVGEEGVKIETVPQVMANASPFFRQMLQPNGFAEGQDISKTGSITVQLPDDDVSAMIILCDIFHLRTRKIPVKDMTSNILANIATLVDKYDCAAAIQPWPTFWLMQLPNRQQLEDTEHMSLRDVGKWIHISCHLGFEEQFSKMTSALIRRASQEDFYRGPLLLDYRKLSQIVQDSIENGRHEGINAYHQLCFNLIEELKEGNHCSFSESNDDQSRELAFDCSSIALGNAILAAKEISSEDNWELVENWIESIDYYHPRMTRFAERLSGSKWITNRSRYKKYYGDEREHQSCLLTGKLLLQIDEIYESCTVGLRLDILGNHVYRNAVGAGDEPEKEGSSDAK